MIILSYQLTKIITLSQRERGFKRAIKNPGALAGVL